MHFVLYSSKIVHKPTFHWLFIDGTTKSIHESGPTNVTLIDKYEVLIVRSHSLRSPNGRRRIAFATPRVSSGLAGAKPAAAPGLEPVFNSSSTNSITTVEQPLALGEKHLEKTTPKDPDQVDYQQVTPIKPIFASKSQGQVLLICTARCEMLLGVWQATLKVLLDL